MSMYVEVALGEDLTLRIEESKDSNRYMVTLLQDDKERMGLIVGATRAEVAYMCSKHYALWAWPGHVCLLKLEDEMQPEPDDLGDGPSYAEALAADDAGPSAEDGPFGEVPAWLAGRPGAAAASGELDLAVWGDALDDALAGEDGEQDAT